MSRYICVKLEEGNQVKWFRAPGIVGLNNGAEKITVVSEVIDLHWAVLFTIHKAVVTLKPN